MGNETSEKNTHALKRVRVVLVSPLYGGNVGSVCRAMKNMGLTDLTIAAPTGGMDEREARIMACHAEDLFEARRETATLEEAVADCGLVAGTTARAGLYREHARTPREWAPRLLDAAFQAPVALVFGPEDRGLSNDELSPCTQLIQIPSSSEYPSLNLAQAVLVCAYELFLAADLCSPPCERSPEAPSELRERMFGLWREALLANGFLREDNADHMMQGVRRILSRGTLTISDVHILMGIARQTLWAARR
jgi:tRNA/rRNA methyltransferase